ncbi:hypothetical protein NPIL_200411 [Nephila pilipes]|uniref:Uncharacterized protein n=1 Tax=Nephila pilipes TaxID=299642 RepID=A0A8X6UDH5_NEPPI|nr:hypothetical protein NPIL_200411 [Nephila pilipes]
MHHETAYTVVSCDEELSCKVELSCVKYFVSFIANIEVQFQFFILTDINRFDNEGHFKNNIQLHVRDQKITEYILKDLKYSSDGRETPMTPFIASRDFPTNWVGDLKCNSFRTLNTSDVTSVTMMLLSRAHNRHCFS